MPNNRDNKKKRPIARTQVLMDASNNLLRRIALAEETQQRGVPPAVPDVQPIQKARNKVFTFAKQRSIGTVTGSTTLDVFGSFQFDLNTTTDAANFQALFDQWRILQISVQFVPNTTGPYQGPVYTVIDYDDANVPTTIASLLEYDTLEITQPGTMITRTFTPKMAVAAYSGVFTSFAQGRAGTWIDVASPSVQHYGLKWGIAALAGGTTTQIYTVTCTVVYQFRNTR
jgi:hypothetical protein